MLSFFTSILVDEILCRLVVGKCGTKIMIAAIIALSSPARRVGEGLKRRHFVIQNETEGKEIACACVRSDRSLLCS